jgi:hypothetical protein
MKPFNAAHAVSQVTAPQNAAETARNAAETAGSALGRHALIRAGFGLALVIVAAI